MEEVPIWEKSNLSLREVAAYFGIGINEWRELTNEKDGCSFYKTYDVNLALIWYNA